MQRTVILESSYALQRSRFLRFSIRYDRAGWGSRLTRYGELVLFGSPIIIEKDLKVDLFCNLFLLCPRCTTVLHLDLHAHLGCRGNTSTDAHASASVSCKESKDIRALGWCPGPVVFRFQLCLLIFYKEPQRIHQLWDVLECNFCMLPEMSRVGLDWSEARTV